MKKDFNQMEQDAKRSEGGVGKLLLIILVVVGVVITMWGIGMIQTEDEEEYTTLPIEETYDEINFEINETEWQNMQIKLHKQQEDIQQLRSEIKNLQTELKALQKSNNKTTTTTTPTTKTTTTTNVDANAVTMVSYTHTWLEETAKLSLRNNTDQTITKISARITYYDMNGNMLDYRDIIKDITIEPKMSRSIQIPGFGTDEHYAYYKSDTFYSQQRKYKVQFELKSCK
jgi:TolA-binding protein